MGPKFYEGAESPRPLLPPNVAEAFRASGPTSERPVQTESRSTIPYISAEREHYKQAVTIGRKCLDKPGAWVTRAAAVCWSATVLVTSSHALCVNKEQCHTDSHVPHDKSHVSLSWEVKTGWKSLHLTEPNRLGYHGNDRGGHKHERKMLGFIM